MRWNGVTTALATRSRFRDRDALRLKRRNASLVHEEAGETPPLFFAANSRIARESASRDFHVALFLRACVSEKKHPRRCRKAPERQCGLEPPARWCFGLDRIHREPAGRNPAANTEARSVWKAKAPSGFGDRSVSWDRWMRWVAIRSCVAVRFFPAIDNQAFIEGVSNAQIAKCPAA